MKELIIPAFLTLATTALLGTTGWLANTAVTLSENSATQTVLLSAITNQVNALVLDVSMLESENDDFHDFMLLHPLTPHVEDAGVAP